MRPVSFGDRLRYRFDNFMSKGTAALVGALFLASSAIIIVVAILLMVTGAVEPGGDEAPGFPTLVWRAAMRAMDAGTLGGDEGSRLYLFLMLIVTIAGIFFVSALIGILNSGLERKLEELRKGRSRVVEDGHTLVLGWSAQIHTIAAELALAAENHGGCTIVVVADRDKVEMEDDLAVKVPDRRGTRIVCRSGNPIDLDDLELGSPQTAKAIVVLGPEGAADPDASVIKTVLALVAHKPRAEGQHHIVAEIRDPKNRVPCEMVGREQVQVVVASEVIARIAVQTCRQSGLSAIYNDLLDFGGEEIYFHRAGGLEGKTFGEALRHFEDSAIIGIRDAEGRTRLNPPMDTIVAEGAELIAIAADDDRVVANGKPSLAVDEAVIAEPAKTVRAPERTLILGWNGRGATIVAELDKYALPGSELLVVAKDDSPKEAIAALREAPKNHTIRTVVGDIADRTLLDALQISSYEHVITLAYAEYGIQEADAITLVTLLHLRDIEDKNGESFSVVSEMLDTKNRRLAEVTQTDDFIVSDVLVSLLITQLAENARLAPVFDDLFDADGSEIYLKPASDYVKSGSTVDFYTVTEAARRRGETAIGYARTGQEAETRLNPKKSERRKFNSSDRVIVLAEG